MTLPEPDFATFVGDDRGATLSDALNRTLGDGARRRIDPGRAAEADTAFARRLVGLFSHLEALREAFRTAAAAGDHVAALKRAIELVTVLSGFAPTANDVAVARASVHFITAAQTVVGGIGRGLFRRRALATAERDRCEWVLRDFGCVLGEHFRLMVGELHGGSVRANWAEATEAYLADIAECVAVLEAA